MLCGIVVGGFNVIHEQSDREMPLHHDPGQAPEKTLGDQPVQLTFEFHVPAELAEMATTSDQPLSVQPSSGHVADLRAYDLCPACGAQMRSESACMYCPMCGYSRCS